MDRIKGIKNSSNRIISGFPAKWLVFWHSVNNLIHILITYRSLSKTKKVVRELTKLRTEISGKQHMIKLLKVNGKIYWRFHVPAWGTKLYRKFFLSELNRIEPHNGPKNRLADAFIAITTKCPLKCEHCFEWNNLNEPERLSSNEIERIIANLQSIGTPTIDLTGGEPMLRLKELLPLIAKYKHSSNFWILTSGFNFTAENAALLKEAGLTGVVVSLDHFEEEQHDRFRGFKGAYSNALQAIELSIENGFVTALSVCITKEHATESFLTQYIELARELEVGMIQLLEPKAVGHFAGKDVALLPEQIKTLEDFYLEFNFNERYRDYPILIYHGYYQRKMGCLAAGSRSVYIDTNGMFLSCPFCHSSFGKASDENFIEHIEALRSKGCAPYGVSAI